jgi:hypothetical protein
MEDEIGGRHAALMGDIRNAYIVLVGKPEMKTPLGRLKRGRRIILKRNLGK